MASKTKVKEACIYRLRLVGLYFGASTDGTKYCPFDVTVRLDNTMTEDEMAIAVFKRLLAPTLMKRKYPDYLGLAECIIAESEREDGKPIDNIFLMTRRQLEAFIEDDDKLDVIDVDLYEDDPALRQAVVDCRKDRESFIKMQEIATARRGGKISMKNAAMRLNEAWDEDAPAPTIDPAEQPLIPKHAPAKPTGKKSDPLEDLVG